MIELKMKVKKNNIKQSATKYNQKKIIVFPFLSVAF